IHPYMDGNGRMGRFLMNVMMATGGYPWTIIPVQRRAGYMAALERASVHQDIVPFSRFLGQVADQAVLGHQPLRSRRLGATGGQTAAGNVRHPWNSPSGR
ncbi:hypothetical protein EN821_33950, partial [Mesorhizobium sp. M2D.F.Ca.ET.178.01.1.1]|uniref:Fic family protein n=1 Tax=Mesorhizobium sp. M2D.F.Ca.ET.178.01.1.1 TaxID=2563937 RepID=UPI00113961A7